MPTSSSTQQLTSPTIKATSPPPSSVPAADIQALGTVDSSSMAEEDSDDEIDTKSMASTVKYDMEPYESFKDKALQLVMDLYPDRNAEDIVLERMSGGGYNRIVGLSLTPSQRNTTSPLKNLLRGWFGMCFGRHKSQSSKEVERLVLRVPRFGLDPEEMKYQLATLAFVDICTPYAIPRVVVHDLTEENAIEAPYMVQRRLTGETLENLWDTLNFGQKASAVRQLTQILLSLNAVKKPSAGIVSHANTHADFREGSVKVDTFPVPNVGVSNPLYTNPNTELAPPQTTKDFLISLCERRKAWEHKSDDTFLDDIWTGFTHIINKLHELGFLPDGDQFHFTHLDFYPRNILAEIENESNIKITGVLDWDMAAFCPQFTSYRPPFFLWDEEEYFDELDEAAALNAPIDSEKQALKKVYEDTAGPEFLKYAYGQEYILARRMFYVLRVGIPGSFEWELAEGIIIDFKKLYP